jgi:hypothetical protein
MESIVITWRELLLLAAIAIFVYVAEAVMFLLKLKKIRPASTTVDMSAVQAQIDGLSARVDLLQQSLSKLAVSPVLPPDIDNPPALAVPLPSPVTRETPSAYGKAIELAKQGLDPDSLASQCGISRGEAELIIALHRFDSA